MNLIKCIGTKYLCFFILLFFTGCSKSDDAVKITTLQFVDSSIPTNSLLSDGGSVSLEVEWAYTRWNVSAGDVVEGSAFITEIAPTYAGSSDQGKTVTKVKITYKSNKNPVQNRQKLELKSLTGNLSQSIVITQSAAIVLPIEVTIDPQTKYQKITGFGGGNMMWGTDYLTPTQMQTVFGSGADELGLSMFRVRLSSAQSDWAGLVPTIKEARKYDVTIFATPWSPPATMKSNNNLVGGQLTEANYGAYAIYLNDFVHYMISQGTSVDAVSVQNEPDWDASYEGCLWSSTQMYNFVKNNGATIQDAKLIAAESLNFNQTYTNSILNDAAAAGNLDIAAGHLYGGGLATYPLAQQKGKEVWMTEYLLNLNYKNSGDWQKATELAKWDESLTMLGTVHQAMTYNWNAYVWWYIRRFYSFIGDGTEGAELGKIQKRGYAFSHYSKFVRPGYYRISSTLNTTADLDITTYSGNNKVVAVLINNENYGFSEVNLTIPSTITAAELHTTSLSLDRQKQVLSPAQNNVKVSLPSRSVTTVVMSY